MQLDDLINEAKHMPRIGEPEYRAGVIDLIARLAPYNAPLSSLVYTERVEEIDNLLRIATTPFVVDKVRVYLDKGSDPAYIDIRTEIVTTHGEWQLTRTHSTDGGERTDGDIMYSPNDNTGFGETYIKTPTIVEEMFARYRHVADDLINIKLRERE